MSFIFGSKKVKLPSLAPALSPTPTAAPEVGEAKESERERLRRMRGRSKTELVSPGFLVPVDTRRRGLKATVG